MEYIERWEAIEQLAEISDEVGFSKREMQNMETHYIQDLVDAVLESDDPEGYKVV